MIETIQSRLHAFIAQFFASVELQDDDDIFALGFINSLFAMQLVLFVENECGVTIESEDLDIANFRSINAIACLVARKLAAQ